MTMRTIYTCDVVVNDEEWQKAGKGGLEAMKHYEQSKCNKPALQHSSGSPIAVMVGNNIYHVCSEHAQSSLLETLKGFRLEL